MAEAHFQKASCFSFCFRLLRIGITLLHTTQKAQLNRQFLSYTGWPMPKKEYKRILEPQRKDAEKVVKLLDKYKVGNGTRFMQLWEEIWNANLDSCEDGACSIRG